MKVCRVCCAIRIGRRASHPVGRDQLAIIEKTATEKPANATHWSARKMAKADGDSHRSVQREWAGAGLKPHLVRTFKVSNDPNFGSSTLSAST